MSARGFPAGSSPVGENRGRKGIEPLRPRGCAFRDPGALAGRPGEARPQGASPKREARLRASGGAADGRENPANRKRMPHALAADLRSVSAPTAGLAAPIPEPRS